MSAKLASYAGKNKNDSVDNFCYKCYTAALVGNLDANNVVVIRKPVPGAQTKIATTKTPNPADYSTAQNGLGVFVSKARRVI